MPDCLEKVANLLAAGRCEDWDKTGGLTDVIVAEVAVARISEANGRDCVSPACFLSFTRTCQSRSFAFNSSALAASCVSDWPVDPTSKAPAVEGGIMTADSIFESLTSGLTGGTTIRLDTLVRIVDDGAAC